MMTTKTLDEIRTLHPAPAFLLESEENEYTRVIVWTTEEEALDDDGSNAIADYVLAGTDRRYEVASMTDLNFIIPPECGGQIVEVSYAVAVDALFKRVHDRSDGDVTVYRADWDDLDPDIICEPWNNAPSVDHDAWVEVAS